MQTRLENFHMVASTLVVISVVLLARLANGLSEGSEASTTVGRFPFLMPKVVPYKQELYLCTPVKVDYTKSYFIVGFEPNATRETVHHFALYGCGAPGSEAPVWNCGEMAKTDDIKEETGSPCGAGASSQILYAWARDAPKLNLPDGVGFKVGLGSPIKYLVLQVHYAHIEKFKDGTLYDDSGVFLHYTLKQMTKQAGVLLLGTGGSIPPNTIEHMESVCTINENKTIHPFAFRLHTHSLGRVVSGYRVRSDEQGKDQWTLLGKDNPLKPQMFYPVHNYEPIHQGDRVAARCTMESNRTTITYIGGTNKDEMCNFYMMYYVENDDPLVMKYCFSSGPPYFYWTNKDTELNNIPDDASQL